MLFTDFGLQGPYIGQMKAVLHRMAPAVPRSTSSPMGRPVPNGFHRGPSFSASSVPTSAGREWPPGAGFWYENSNGLAEIAVNQGRADRDLGLAIGSPVEFVA